MGYQTTRLAEEAPTCFGLLGCEDEAGGDRRDDTEREDGRDKDPTKNGHDALPVLEGCCSNSTPDYLPAAFACCFIALSHDRPIRNSYGYGTKRQHSRERELAQEAMLFSVKDGPRPSEPVVS